MIFSIHGGHNSIVQGANAGGRKEHVMDREVKDAVISKLRALGHTVYDDTDEVGRTQNANLNNLVANCNSHYVDLVVSIHLNAFNGTANGVEVCYYDKKELAQKVAQQLANDIGWKLRGDGGAVERKELAVLKGTKAPAILLELGFIDNEDDMAKWDVNRIANAIVKALTGQTINTSKPEPTPTPSKPVSNENGIGVLTINGYSVNVRKGPGTAYSVAKKVNKGEAYIVWSVKDNWYNVGGDQWIFGDKSYTSYKSN